MAKKKKETGTYATFALADKGKVDNKTNTTQPTEQGVRQAKAFVDENAK